MLWVLPPPKAVWSWTTGSPPWAVRRCDAGDQQIQQALGEVGAAEELERGPGILGSAVPAMHLAEVGGELGLHVAPAGHVGMGLNDIAPGHQARP